MTMPSSDADGIPRSFDGRDQGLERREISAARRSAPAGREGASELADRAMLRDSLRKAIAQAHRDGRATGVLCVGLRGLEDVAARFGQDDVQTVLTVTAERLMTNVRRTDTVAALDTGEFAIVQVAVDDARGCYALARRLARSLQATIAADGNQISPTIDVGIAVAETDDEDPECWIQQARSALVMARNDPTSSCRCSKPELDAQLQARLSLEHELRVALLERQLVLHYQPIVELASRQVAAFEALLRWQHPSRGLLMPPDFLEVAEDSGLILEVGDWVLRQACRDASAWPDAVKVATNASLVELRDPSFSDRVRRALRATDLDPSRLQIEVSEQPLVRLSERALPTLHKLKATGVAIAMDDFGTGQSSLGHLQGFPFDEVKIDQSVMARAGSQQAAAALVRAVISIGHSFGMTVTAEGVETDGQLELLRDEGCDQVQGYYFSRPMPMHEVDRLITLINVHSQGHACVAEAARN